MLRKSLLFLVAALFCLSLGAGLAPAADQAPKAPAAKGKVKTNKFKDGKLNLNAATKEDLLKIEGITPALADAILKLRKKNGEMVDLDELLDIKGVDNKLLRQLRRKVYLEPASDCNC